jgi:DNA-binding NtrC family response regulator
LPPLQDRDGDVVEIAIKLLRDYAAEEGKAFRDFDAAAEACLRSCLWPGNVRQLQNVIRHLVVLHEGTTVTADMLPLTVRNVSLHIPSPTAQPRRHFGNIDSQLAGGGPASSPALDDESVTPLWLLERDMIERAIRRCDGNIPRAAALLEVAPFTIYRKRQSWIETDLARRP